VFLKLAIRNVLRNRRRTVITEVAIVTGLVAIVFIGSYLHGMQKEWAGQLIDSVSGHLTVVRSDYLERGSSRPLKLALTDLGKLYSALDAEPLVEGAVARLELGGLIGTGEQSTTFFGMGIDLSRVDRGLPKGFASVVEGRRLTAKDQNGAVLGIRLADNLKLKIGDTVLLATNTVDGQTNAIEVVVQGLMRTGEEVIDDNFVVISLAAAQDLLAMPNRASHVVVRLRSGEQAAHLQQRLSAALRRCEPQATVRTWMEMNQEFTRVKVMFDSIAYVIGIILFFIVSAGVANTMLMSAFERTREIGTIRAIGTTRRQVVWMFLLESLVIGTIGTVIGLAAAAVITLIAGQIGVPFPTPPGATGSYTIHPAISWSNMIGGAAVVMVMSLLAGIYPARFAARLDPIEALRHA
jgi:putative ABC transport system permease protein